VLLNTRPGLRVLLALRRVRKIAKNDYYLRRVCLSIRMEKLGSHWTDCHRIWYLGILLKYVENSKFLLKSGKGRVLYTKTYLHL